VGSKEYTGKESVASCVMRLGYGERHVSMDRLIPFVPIVKDITGSLKSEVEFITDPKVSKKIIDRIIGQEIKINEIENFNLVLESVIAHTIGKHEVQMPTESMFVFHKLLTFVQRETSEKLKKDLYYVYYMLRFCPSKEDLTHQVKLFIKNKEQGRRVKQNLRKYFNTVNSEGPIVVEQENGPDEYIHFLREDIFERFSILREKD